MFLHHTMTDREILRSCEGCESPHLRLVAERLRDRIDNIREIERCLREINASSWEEVAERIGEICESAIVRDPQYKI